MKFTLDDLQRLRDETGFSLSECQLALLWHDSYKDAKQALLGPGLSRDKIITGILERLSMIETKLHTLLPPQ